MHLVKVYRSRVRLNINLTMSYTIFSRDYVLIIINISFLFKYFAHIFS